MRRKGGGDRLYPPAPTAISVSYVAAAPWTRFRQPCRMKVIVGVWPYLKRALLRKPDHPRSTINLGLSAYAGCLAIVIGLSHSFSGRPELGPILVALGLHTLLTGAAESLPIGCRGVVALRILGYLVALTFVALAVAVIAYGDRIW